MTAARNDSGRMRLPHDSLILMMRRLHEGRCERWPSFAARHEETLKGEEHAPAAGTRRDSNIAGDPRCYGFGYSCARAPARRDLERNPQLAEKGTDVRTS